VTILGQTITQVLTKGVFKRKSLCYHGFMSSNIVTLPTRITSSHNKKVTQTAFDRKELGQILSVYGRMVSAGHWKDYAMDFLPDRAIFSVYRKASEHALYRIEKTPALRKRQGQFSVIAPGGLILKRGHDLKAVLGVFDKKKFQLK